MAAHADVPTRVTATMSTAEIKHRIERMFATRPAPARGPARAPQPARGEAGK